MPRPEDGVVGSLQAWEPGKTQGVKEDCAIYEPRNPKTVLSFRFICKMRRALACLAKLWVRTFCNVVCCLNVKKNYVNVHYYYNYVKKCILLLLRNIIETLRFS